MLKLNKRQNHKNQCIYFTSNVNFFCASTLEDLLLTSVNSFHREKRREKKYVSNLLFKRQNFQRVFYVVFYFLFYSFKK